ncbi:DUF2182 domain-containing protein [Streptomyces cirratus]|uniref:copper chaperone n=1 Tax=Streptomyces cirratus TaxID=68187 RepID=UPI0036134DC8
MTGGPAAVRIRAAPVGLLLVAAAAWVWMVTRWGGMPAMPGTMGLGLGAFLAVWTLMMTAMMLPATAPVAALYARTITVHRAPRMAVFTVAYLLVWAAAGLPAYALAVGLGRAARLPPRRGRRWPRPCSRSAASTSSRPSKTVVWRGAVRRSA